MGPWARPQPCHPSPAISAPFPGSTFISVHCGCRQACEPSEQGRQVNRAPRPARGAWHFPTVPGSAGHGRAPRSPESTHRPLTGPWAPAQRCSLSGGLAPRASSLTEPRPCRETGTVTPARRPVTPRLFCGRLPLLLPRAPAPGTDSETGFLMTANISRWGSARGHGRYRVRPLSLWFADLHIDAPWDSLWGAVSRPLSRVGAGPCRVWGGSLGSRSEGPDGLSQGAT